MLLDELVDVIQTIQDRIRDHGASLRENETRTRMALIDPLLQALGWDTADPGLVTPEYNVSGKRADYALLDGKRSPVVFLEAKRLDELLSNHRSQVAAYASELGIKYPALTNGNDWEVYDNSKLVPIEQRSILNLSIKDSEAHQLALRLLLLWRPNLASGQPVAASESVLSNASRTAPTATEPVSYTQPQVIVPPQTVSGGVVTLQSGLQSTTSTVSQSGNPKGKHHWAHPDQPDKLLTLDQAYQMAKTNESESKMENVPKRVEAGQLSRKSFGNYTWKIKQNTVKAAGYTQRKDLN